MTERVCATGIRRYRSPSEAEQLVRSFEASSLTRVEFCARNQVAPTHSTAACSDTADNAAVVESCRRLGIPLCQYLASVLPGLAEQVHSANSILHAGCVGRGASEQREFRPAALRLCRRELHRRRPGVRSTDRSCRRGIADIAAEHLRGTPQASPSVPGFSGSSTRHAGSGTRRIQDGHLLPLPWSGPDAQPPNPGRAVQAKTCSAHARGPRAVQPAGIRCCLFPQDR